MKYLILCGNTECSEDWPDTELYEINGEKLINRTVRLLKEFGVNDIYIVSDKDEIRNLVPEVTLIKMEFGKSAQFIDEFFNINEPVCYLFGNIYYSYTAINQIVKTKTTDVDMFISSNNCICFKMIDYIRFFRSIKHVRNLYNSGQIENCSAWAIWDDLQDVEERWKRFDNFIEIDDFTYNINSSEDLKILHSMVSDQNILIHCVPKRLNYVLNFIIPDLESQFIDKIKIFNDVNLSGNLSSFIDSLKELPDNGSTWHIQDDVLISPRFAQTINGTKDEIICGFSSKYDRYNDEVTIPKNMWWSFPCIKIPNNLSKEFIIWCTPENMKFSRFKDCIKENKGDDALFKEFLEEKYPEELIKNLNPNIVNHVDYMLGGSISNPQRYKIVKKCMSRMWPEEEKYLVDELQKILLG